MNAHAARVRESGRRMRYDREVFDGEAAPLSTDLHGLSRMNGRVAGRGALSADGTAIWFLCAWISGAVDVGCGEGASFEDLRGDAVRSGRRRQGCAQYSRPWAQLVWLKVMLARDRGRSFLGFRDRELVRTAEDSGLARVESAGSYCLGRRHVWRDW